MAIVKEIVHGECKSHILDDHIRTDPEEVKGIINRIELIAYEVLMEKKAEEESRASI